MHAKVLWIKEFLVIVYKLDKPTQIKAGTQIKDMSAVLSELSPTLRLLRGLLNDHQVAISEPNINQYRNDLLRMTDEAIRLTHLIATNAQRLVGVSEQTAKYLSTIEEQIASALQGRNGEFTNETPAQHTTQASAGIGHRPSRAIQLSNTPR